MMVSVLYVVSGHVQRLQGSSTLLRVPCKRVALQVGELEEALEAIKWGTDYLLNCHVEPTKFVAMFGNSEVRPPSVCIH